MRRVSFFIAAAMAAPAMAQPVSVAPWMTGQHLVELAAWPAGARSNLDLTPQQDRDQQLAQMYVAGVHDTTEGKDWCFSAIARPKPGTLIAYALDGLRAMTPDQLKRPASDLIVQTWRSKYPEQGPVQRP